VEVSTISRLFLPSESNQLEKREQVFASGQSHDNLKLPQLLMDSLLIGWSETMSTLQARSRMKNLLLFVPNTVLLCGRLMTDSRVPRTERALVAGAIVYAIIPFDLIPDMIPFVGQIDDAYLIALTLLRLMDRTDERILREHWNGGGDIVQLVEATAMIAGKFLPKRIRRVLTSRVAVAKEREDEEFLLKPLLVAYSDEERQGTGSRQ